MNFKGFALLIYEISGLGAIVLLLLAHAQNKGVVLRLSECVEVAGKLRPIVIGATIQ